MCVCVCVIVEDLRAFMSSNIPASVSDQFPRTIEQLLRDYLNALGPSHASMEAWEMPAELMKRAFNGAPPPTLTDALQQCCLRVPHDRESFFWAMFRQVVPDVGVRLVRAWLLEHNPGEVSRMERSVQNVHQQKGEHAAALDLMRWVEGQELQCSRSDPERWRALYLKVLRHTAEERAASMKRGGAGHRRAAWTWRPRSSTRPTSRSSSRSTAATARSSPVEVPLRNITTSEAAILRDALGGGSDPRVQIERQRLLDSTAADGLGNAELQERQRRLLIANQQEASRSAFGMNGTWGELQGGGSFSLQQQLAGLAQNGRGTSGLEPGRVGAGLPELQSNFGADADDAVRARARAARARARGREKRARWARWRRGRSAACTAMAASVGIAGAAAGAASGSPFGGLMADAAPPARRRRGDATAPPPGVADVDGIGLGDLESGGADGAPNADGELVMGANGRPERRPAPLPGNIDVTSANGRWREPAHYAQLAAERALLRGNRGAADGAGDCSDDDAAADEADFAMPGDAEMANSMFTPMQLKCALEYLQDLDLKSRVPEQLDDVEGWQNFVYELFVTEGWRHLAQRYNLSGTDKLVTKQCLVGDVERLQQAMRASAESGAEAAEQLKGLDWLKQLVKEHVQGVGIDDAELVEKEPGDIGEHLAFEIGQAIVWSQQMAPDSAERDATRGDDGYFHAPAQAQSSLKLAFMHAADQLCSPRSVRTNELIDSPGADGRAADGAGANGDGDGGRWRDGPRPSGDNRQLALIHELLPTDPEAALRAAQGAIDEAHTRAAMGSEGSDAVEAHSLLQLVCGDATFALQRYKECIHHYQRYLAKGASPLAAHQYQSGHAHLIAQHHASHLATRQRWQGEQMQLPLDAQLEYICSMLVESYPAAQVMQAAEDGCLFEGHLHEGWLLLSKVLSELIDVDDAIEQARDLPSHLPFTPPIHTSIHTSIHTPDPSRRDRAGAGRGEPPHGEQAADDARDQRYDGTRLAHSGWLRMRPPPRFSPLPLPPLQSTTKGRRTRGCSGCCRRGRIHLSRRSRRPIALGRRRAGARAPTTPSSRSRTPSSRSTGTRCRSPSAPPSATSLATSSRRPCTRSSPRSPAGARTRRRSRSSSSRGGNRRAISKRRPPPRRSSRSPNSSFRSSRS